MTGLFGHYLTTAALDELARYQYKAGAWTVIDNFLNPFWNFVVTLVPMGIAPNILTLIAFCMTLLPVLLIGYYNPLLNAEMPSYVYFVTGIWNHSTI